MSDSSNGSGFSFLLSDSPPAAEVKSSSGQAQSGHAAPQEGFLLDFGATDEPPKKPSTNPESPTIKRIEFPARSSAQPTQFSASVQRQRMEVTDEDPFPRLSPPEDLPSSDSNIDPAWGQETPTAGQLWKKAQTGLGKTAQCAASWGTAGMHRSRDWAAHASTALKERLQAHAEQTRQKKLASPAQSAQPAKGEQDASAPPLQQHLPQRQVGPRSQRFPLKPLLTTLGRKVAAPASAMAAAAVVYAIGTSVFGTEGIALNAEKTAPGVPELGELEQASAQGSTRNPAAPDRTKDRTKGQAMGPAEGSSGPPPMQTEETEMPDGLSWPGKGLIEVVTAEDELIYVDGVFTGRGPLRRIPVGPGDHEISIKKDGEKRQGVVAVQVDRCTRAVFKSE